jgi:RNA 2',3'-cyclic 3'-phosphodiesterase
VTKPDAIAASVAGDDRIRLFCGLRPSDETVACLAAWQAAHLPPDSLGRVGGRRAHGEHVRAMRLVPPEHLHLTLAFLGHRPVGEVEAIGAELRAAAAAAGPVELRPLRYRETRSVGMVVYEDVDGAATALAEELQARLEGLGVYRRESRAWLPHVTVVRFRERAGLRLEAPNRCSIHDVRAALYRSDLGAGGARYTELETAALGGR